MKKNKNMYYWLGGLAVLLVVAVAAIFSQGSLFSGYTGGLISPAPSVNTVIKIPSGSPSACTYTYNDWSLCNSSNMQARTVKSVIPAGCSGTPVLSQKCTPCTDYNYSAWSACAADGTQTRTKISSNPASCVPGATPFYTRSCINTPAMVAPSNGSTIPFDSTASVQFSWNPVPNAAYYYLALQDNNSPTDHTFHRYQTSTANYSMPISSLRPTGQYMWFVEAYKADGTLSENPANYWIFTISQAVQCTNNLAVNVSPVQSPGGNMAGGQTVSLGKWNISSSNTVMLNNLTFNADKIAALSNLKLYVGTTQIGSITGYYGDPTGAIRVMSLNQAIPAGTTITIEAKGLANNPNSAAPVVGDTLKLKLSSIDQLVDGMGNTVNCGITNNAANTYGPIYTLQAAPL